MSDIMKIERLILGKEEAEIFSELTFEERGRLVSRLLSDLGLFHIINGNNDFKSENEGGIAAVKDMAKEIKDIADLKTDNDDASYNYDNIMSAFRRITDNQFEKHKDLSEVSVTYDEFMELQNHYEYWGEV
ncbi:MAG: hypothetical protein LBU09_02695 [Endomicrobium sp.]|jgi:hypothetical protein|nr:hypothetical protein [Endomicrobium sp.]